MVRDISEVISVCLHDFEAFFCVVTIYKVRESGVEKEVGFHFILEQIRKLYVLSIRVFFPLYRLALWVGRIVTIINAKNVVIDNDHKFFCVLTENKLAPSICLKLLFILWWFDQKIKLKVEEFSNSFFPLLY